MCSAGNIFFAATSVGPMMLAALYYRSQLKVPRRNHLFLVEVTGHHCTYAWYEQSCVFRFRGMYSLCQILSIRHGGLLFEENQQRRVGITGSRSVPVKGDAYDVLT
jgi:hypothetical protein